MIVRYWFDLTGLLVQRASSVDFLIIVTNLRNINYS
jgi:hypothetical protein